MTPERDDNDRERYILGLEFRRLEEQIATSVAMFDLKLSAKETALQLQATEYERRLEVLNHAHDEAVRVQNTYVPRDLFDERLMDLSKQRDEDMKWRDEVNKALASIAGRSAGYSVAVGLVLTLVMIVMRLLGK